MSSRGFIAATRSMSMSYRSKPLAGLQRKFCALISTHWLRGNKHWHNLLARRISDFGYDTNAPHVSMFTANVRTALNAIPQRKRQGVAMMYIKTITNSWFTIRRMANAGVPQLNCIFGCEDCVDDLSHYLRCGALWPLVCSAMKLDDSWASLVGIDTVAFPGPDPIHMYTTCVMCKC